MAKCYPDTIPYLFNHSEALSEAYRMGWSHGHGFACHNVPELGSYVWCESLGRVHVTPENIREVHESFCFESEQASRDYSPFEYTAHRFNSSEEAEDLWEAFDAGIHDAIYADIAEYTDEDYRIAA